MDSDLAAQLRSGGSALGLDLDLNQVTALLAYQALLQKWNHAYNLTAVRDPAQMVIRHLLDSLALGPHLRGQRFIDVGTGAGLPGIPMAILFPGRKFDLLDSNGKKARFLFQVKTALRLDNMQIHHARVESFRPPEPYDAVLSRAFSSLADMVAGCGHLLGTDGHFLAMKGNYPTEELAALAPDYAVRAVHALVVPGLEEQRHLVDLVIQKNWRRALKETGDIVGG